MANAPACLILLAAATPAFGQGTAVFRGNLARTGVFEAPGVPQFHKIKWQAKTGGRVMSSPVLADGVVYAGSHDGAMYALDAETGTTKWRFATKSAVTGSAAVSDGLVYFGSFDGAFYAVDAATGKAKWSFATAGERRFSHKNLHGMHPAGEAHPDCWDLWLSSPAVTDGTVYFGSGDNNIYALDAATGALRWKFATGNVVHSSPAVAGGVLYVGSWDSYLYALDTATGTLKWKFKTGEDPKTGNQQGFQGSPAVVDGVVYVGCRDAHVYAVDATTGKQLWKQPTQGSWIVASPAVQDGMVYAGTSDSAIFLALDARTGQPAWRLDTKTFVFSSAAVAGGMAYLGTFDGKLRAINLKTHEEAWIFETQASKDNLGKYVHPSGKFDFAKLVKADFWDEMVTGMERLFSTGSIVSSPLVAGKVIYVGSADAHVYALE